MKPYLDKFIEIVKKLWVQFYGQKPPPPRVDELGQPLPPLPPEERRKAFRTEITEYVASGWSIEIENDFDAVLNKKGKFSWAGKLIIFLILLVVFAPIALFYLIVVIIQGVSVKPARLRLWIDEDGRIKRA
jgi:hypothetical protein